MSINELHSIDKEKYKKQNQALNYILEEMVANEFGNMFTDAEYMSKLKTSNPSLFTKIVDAIKKFFKSLNKSSTYFVGIVIYTLFLWFFCKNLF